VEADVEDEVQVTELHQEMYLQNLHLQLLNKVFQVGLLILKHLRMVVLVEVVLLGQVKIFKNLSPMVLVAVMVALEDHLLYQVHQSL
jgi:hypothetical protein